MSFADMMTLLFCLFMVLFAISSVNTSKFEALQQSLQDAFSGAVLDGGKSMLNSGSDEQKTKQSAVEPPLPSLRPLTAINNTSAQERRRGRPRRPSRRSRTSARSSGASTSSPRTPACTGKVNVTVRRRGLVIQLLTDKVFFDSGDATLQARGAQAGRQDRRRSCATSAAHPVVVEGYTDSQPISNSQYPVQLGPVRRSRRGGRQRLRADRRPGRPDVPAGLRQPDPDRQQLHGGRPCEEPPGRDRPLPHHTSSTDTESTP